MLMWKFQIKQKFALLQKVGKNSAIFWVMKNIAFKTDESKSQTFIFDLK